MRLRTWTKAGRRVLGLFGCIIVALLALVVGVLLHVDVAATRRLVVTAVNDALAGSFLGSVRVERIGGIGLGGIRGVHVEVRDPSGLQVLDVDGVRVDLDLARSAFGKQAIEVEVPLVAIGNVDVNLGETPEGDLRIARAFASRSPAPAAETSGPSRAVRVAIGRVWLGHAWAHGAPNVDADAWSLAGSANVDTAGPKTVQARLDGVRLRARGLPRHLDPSGSLRGHLTMPAQTGSGVAVEAVFDGEVAGLPTTADARLDDRRVDVRVDAHRRAGAPSAPLVAELAAGEAVALHAEAHGVLPRVDGHATLEVGGARVEAKANVDTGEPLRVNTAVRARNVDLRALLPAAPTSQLGLDARADVAIERDGPHGEVQLDTVPGTVAESRVPPLALRGRLDGRRARFKARIEDARMPTELSVEIVPRTGDALAVLADLRAKVPSLAELPEIGGLASGRAEIAATARLLVPEKTLERATVALQASHVRAKDVAVSTLSASAVLSGTLDAPVVQAALHGEGIAAPRGGVGAIGANGHVALAKGTLQRGALHVGIAGAHADGMKDGSAIVDAAIDGRDVELAVRADVGDAGKIDLRTERLRIGGPVQDARSWARAHGKVALAAAVDLGRVLAILPQDTLPVADLGGSLSVRGTVARDRPDAPPEVQLHAHTEGLLAAGRSAPPTAAHGLAVEAPPSWRVDRLDVGMDVRTDGPSGLTGVSVRVTDPRGPVIALDAKTILPFDALAAQQEARLLEAPVNVRATVPWRRIDELPAIAAVQGAKGSIAADLEASGTLLAPHVRLTARTRGVRTSAMPPELDTDADVEVDYDGEAANILARAASHGCELLRAEGRVDARVRDLVLGKRALPWKASGNAKLASFPLESIPPLAEQQLRGRVSGEVVLDGLHANARASGKIALEHLVVGTVAYPRGSVTIDAADRKLALRARLEQTDGFLDVSADTGLAWGAAVAPSIDRAQPISASVDAEALRAAALQPFVGSSLASIDGLLDAHVRARAVPGAPGASLDGKVTFRGGRLQVAALGEELRAVRATATFAPDGTIRVTDVFARGTRGELRGEANARLEGMRLAKAQASIRIPARNPFSLAIQGEPIGELSGTIKVEATQPPGDESTKVVVEIPRMALELLDLGRREVQTLEEKENIRVGVYRAPNRFVRLPLDEDDLRKARGTTEAEPSRTEIDVRLGTLRISRGNQLRVDLSGHPQVTLVDGETTVRGEVTVAGGWIDVQGKKFEIEKGTISFSGDVPPDPTVVATAGWTAADGTRVYADFIGPTKTGKVTLRSEPPRPRNEILALVLFGTPDGANPQPGQPGTQSDGAARAAVGLGGGLVAQGLTEALDDLAGIQATARVDTTRANNPRPEIEFQLSPRVSIAFSHVIGTPPVAEPDRNFANLEYRFYRNWSLETTVGDRGTALVDAIWQKRY